MTYVVHEAFLTLQGEGAHAGARAVFVRFAGCNVWSGREKDRERDTAKGCCAAWCDTQFVGTGGTNGGVYSAVELALLVRGLWDAPGVALVVCTGGEPGLQVDVPLVSALRGERCRVHVETNGSQLLPAVDWVTLSPKPPMRVVAQHYDEVKVVVPAVDPAAYGGHAPIRWVQPLDAGDVAENTRAAVRYAMDHPEWKLSAQVHKVIGLR